MFALQGEGALSQCSAVHSTGPGFLSRLLDTAGLSIVISRRTLPHLPATSGGTYTFKQTGRLLTYLWLIGDRFIRHLFFVSGCPYTETTLSQLFQGHVGFGEDLSSIDHDGLTGNKGCFIAGQKQCGIGDIFDRSQPACGNR